MDSNFDSMLIENEIIVPVSIEFSDDISIEDIKLLCRLCGNSSHQLLSIFSNDGDEHKISDKIKEHLPIIQVSDNDVLPLSICYQCASTLISWHELYYACKDVDQRFRDLYAHLKIYKSKSEENLVEIPSDDNKIVPDDSLEPPEQPDSSSKTKILVPDTVGEEIIYDSADNYNIWESSVQSDPTEDRKDSFVKDDLKASVSENKLPAPPSNESDSNSNLWWCSQPRSPADDAKSAVLGGPCAGTATGAAADEYRPPSAADMEAVARVPLPFPRTSPSGRFRCCKCDRRFTDSVFLNMHYNEGRVVFASPATFHELYEQMRSHPLVPPDKIDAGWPFACWQCGQRFETKRATKTHIYCYHASVAKFKCDFCSQRFVTECDLAEHRVAHSVERQLVCVRCGRRRATGTLPYETCRERIAFDMCACKYGRGQLPVCGQTDAVAVSCVLKARACDERQREAAAREERRRQRAEALDNLGKVCDECGKEFATRLSLKRHFRLHQHPSECPICGKRYGRAYMKVHMQIHAQEKAFVCQQCGKSFAQLSSLRSHQLLEADVRKFICNVCGMRFVLSSRFQSHLKTHLEEPPFKCEDCGRGYGYIWQLRQHSVRHSDVRPFECELCGRAYKTVKHLRQHGAVHQKAARAVK